MDLIAWTMATSVHRVWVCLLHNSTLVTKQPLAKPVAVISSAEDIARFLIEAKNRDGDPLLLEAIEAYLYDTNKGK